jgi:hypothetical protein
MIRSQACIGARRSSVTTRAGRMADRGYLHDGAWSMLTNLVRIARRVAAMVGLTFAASSIHPPVPWILLNSYSCNFASSGHATHVSWTHTKKSFWLYSCLPIITVRRTVDACSQARCYNIVQETSSFVCSSLVFKRDQYIMY